MSTTQTLSDEPYTANWTWRGAIGALLAGSGLVGLAGLPGAIAGTLLLVGWYALPSVYAVAGGSILFAALAPSPWTSLWSVAVLLGLFVLLLAPRNELAASSDHILVAGVAACGWGALAWMVSTMTTSLWPVALTLVGGGAFVLYAVHRYELVVVVEREGHE